MYKLFFKRIFDIIFSILALTISAPLLLLSMLLLSIANQGSPFFFQTRPGKNEKLFKIIKFKTMNDAKDGDGNLLGDAQRLTKVGSWVRKSSIDELPQLINVLIGDMSLIGPRPLLVQYLPIYSNFQKGRHKVKPGITGWAQVNGRNAISWNQKFDYDLEYVNNISLLFDLKIIFKTIKKVIVRDGISQEGQVTAEYFNGNN